MTRRIVCFGVVVVIPAPNVAAERPDATYLPDRSDWQKRLPREAGLDAAALEGAIKFAIANESPAPRDQVLAHAQSFGQAEAFDALIGPTRERAALNGLVIRGGYVVAAWGDTRRVDLTYSVTKTFFSTVVSLAWHKGLIRDVTDKVREYMPPDVDLSAPPHTHSLTCEHLLRPPST